MFDFEDEVFGRKRFDLSKLPAAGFIKEGEFYILETPLEDRDFSARITVTENGTVTGTVYDNINGEEYKKLRIAEFDGPYVNSVRNCYVKLLKQISGNCCRDVLFHDEQSNRVAELVFNKYGIRADFPFDDGYDRNYGVFRHTVNLKWFGIVMNVGKKSVMKNGSEGNSDFINIKLPPDKIVELLKREGFYPGYHMNHKYWISIILDGTLGDGEIMELISESYELTK